MSIGSNKTNIAIVGTGYWGKNHVRTFHDIENVNIKWCCDLNEENLKEVNAQYPEITTTANFEDVLNDPNTQAIVIATSVVTHYDLAKKSILAGKHTFIEKPMTLKVSESEELVKLAEEHNVILMVGHSLEYHPAILKLQEIINTGELGDIYYLYCQRLNLGKVRTNENALWSLAPHDISIILMLLAEEPDKVSASGGKFLQKNIEDVVFVDLFFPSGKIAHTHISWLDPHKIRKLTVVGSKKMATFDDMASEKITIYDKAAIAKKITEQEKKALVEPFDLKEGEAEKPEIPDEEPLKLECLHFIDCIQNNKTPKTDGRDGLRVLKVLEAATESLKEGGKLINL